MNADGTQKRRLAATKPDYMVTPSWSARGVIAFASDDGGIWTVSASGSGLRRLGPTDGRNTAGLAWSPDGTKLAFTHGDGDYEVFVMNADGSGLENLTDNEKVSDGSPTWSPDGDAIAFVSDRVDKLNQVFVMRADGSDQTQLTDDRRGSSRWNDIYGPVWSPVAG
jgi:Tol biopolymer transport system component